MQSLFKIFFTATLLFCQVVMAQILRPVQLTTSVMPPYTTDYYEYADKTRLTIVGNGLPFYLKLHIRGASGIELNTRPEFLPGPYFVEQNQMVVYTATELFSYFNLNNLIISGISQEELTSYGLPPGRYQICFQAFDRSGENPASLPPPAGCSPYFEIKELLPPTIIRPVCGSELKYQEIQNIMFSWAPVTGAPPGTPYTLRVVEVTLQGQSPGDALLTATSPAFFEETVYGQNSYFYGPSAPLLEPGKMYAWEVIAGASGQRVDFSQSLRFQNQGRSQPCYFTISDAETPGMIITGIKPDYQVEISKGNQIIQNIPHSIIRGKLEFRFMKEEEILGTDISGFLASQKLPDEPIPDPNISWLLGDANVSSALGENPEEDYSFNIPGGKTVSLSGSDLISKETVNKAISYSSFTVSELSTSMVSAAVSDPYLAKGGNKVYPGAKVQVDLYVDLAKLSEAPQGNGIQLVNPNISSGGYISGIKLTNKVKIGSTLTDDNGEFNLLMFNPNINGWPSYIHDGKTYIVSEVIVKPKTPYVEFPERIIAIPKNDEVVFDLGTINGIAKTYRWLPHAVDADNPEVQLNAEVRIFRKKSLYTAAPLLVSEKDGRKLPETPSGWSATGFFLQSSESLETILISNSSVIIPRLFYSGNATDEYFVSISAPGYHTYTTPMKYLLLQLFGVSTEPFIQSPIYQYQQVFKLMPKPPSVNGIVADKETEFPLQGVTVKLRIPGKPGVITAMTNDQGEFSLKNVAPSQTPYILSLSGSSVFPYEHPHPVNVFQGGLDINLGVIYVDARLVTVVGKVHDTDNLPLADAQVTIKNKPGESLTNAQGRFLLKATPGEHTLIVTKPGYKTEEKKINVPAHTGGQNDPELSLVDNWTQNLKQTEWFTSMASETFPQTEFNPASFNVSALSLQEVSEVKTVKDQLMFSPSQLDYNALFNSISLDMLAPGNQTPQVFDAGIIILKKFMVEVIVKAEGSDEGIENATVSFSNQTLNGITGPDGRTVMEDIPFGQVDMLVKGPDTEDYIARYMDVIVQPVSDTQTIHVYLTEGARLTGKAFSGDDPLSGVSISLEGMEFINTQTDGQGNYILNGIPLGYQAFKAVKPGYIGDQKGLQVETGEQQLNFSLDNPGFAADKLLGFDIVLESWTLGSDTTITGYFKNIPGNTIYEWPVNTTLAFSNQKITVKNNIPEPKGGNEITTDISQLQIKMAGIPVTLENPQGIRVREAGEATQGEVIGTVRLNPQNAFPGLQELHIPLTKKLILKHHLKPTETPLEVFRSSGNPGYSLEDLRLHETGTGTWKIYQFNFTPNFAQTSIKNDGIWFKGQVNITGIAGLNQFNLGIDELWLTTQGKVQKVSLASSPQATFKLYTWDFSINSGNINQYGISTNGNLKVPVPSSPLATISYSQLFLTPSGITAGQFHVGSQGLDIFQIVKFKTQGNTSLTFGKQPGQNAYYLLGTGNINLPKYIPGNISMTSFRVQTNNVLMAEAKANLNMNFLDFAKIKINSIGFQSGSNPRIRVDGDIELFLPFFQASAGGVNYYRNNHATVDNLNIGINLAAIATANVNVQFKNNGFAGGGKLKLNMTPIDVGINFNYEKLSGGMLVEANFVAGVTIPVGVLTITKVGGGFSFNTAQKKYTITVSGGVTIAPGTDYLVALDPISVTVGGGPAGPVMEGSASAKVLTWSLAQAKIVLNYPERYFSIDAKVGGGFTLVPKLSVSANAGVVLAISGKQNNRYWLSSFYSNVSMAGFFNTSTMITAGWNMNKNQNPQLAPYVMFIPVEYLTNGNTLNGFHFKSYVFFGRKSDNPWRFSFGIGSISAYFYNESFAELYTNFLTNTYGIKVGSGWGGGGSVSLFGFGVGGAGVDAHGVLYGGLQSGHWNFGGELGARAKGWIGSCSGGCGVKVCFWGPFPKGAQICINRTLKVDYNTQTGNLRVRLE